MFGEAFGLAVFLEVQRQYLIWRLRWEGKVIPVATWIYLLQNHGRVRAYLALIVEAQFH